MKKILFIFSALLIFSCSSSDDNSNEKTDNLTDNPAIIPPILTTKPVTNINPYTASSGVITEPAGGYTYTTKGICWSINHNPTLSDNFSEDNSNLEIIDGISLSQLTNLKSNTTYYLRAYMNYVVYVNTVPQYKLLYGNEISFTTLTTQNLSIGQNYAGGIIAYILQPGDLKYKQNEVHGLISKSFLPRVLAWESAKVFCNSYNNDNYNDWHLPFTSELLKIHDNLYKKGIGGYVKSEYWSSTDISAWKAETVTFDYGNSGNSMYIEKHFIPTRTF